MQIDTEKSNTLIIWDSKAKPPPEYNQLMLWNSYDSNEIDGIYSISEIIERNAEVLRSEYLEAIFKIGEHEFNGKKIVDHLEIKKDFSYWWMTLINEKSNFSKSPQINNAIKILGLKEWLKKNQYTKITVVTHNDKLAEGLKIYCNLTSIKFNWQKDQKQKNTSNLHIKIYHMLPYYLKSLVWFVHHLKNNWHMKGVGVNEWKKTNAKVTFVSYLFNLEPESKTQGFFKSNYWTVLTQKLKENEIKSNWLHIYVKDNIVPNALEAKKTIKQFNKSHRDEQIHVTLHSFLSIKLVISVLKDWFYLIKIQTKLKIIIQKKSSFLWPFIKEDYLNSLIGSSALNNLLVFNLFHNAIGKLPYQEKGFFLQENQSWEYSLIYFWKKFGHANCLVGVPHTPIKFWDLRFYFDKRCYRNKNKRGLPLPSYVGVNGKIAMKAYVDSGYPKKNLIELEALRYLYLNQIRPISKVTNSIDNRILVLGDYSKDSTIHLMQLLQKASKHMNKTFELVVKPHPSCEILAEDYPDLNILITHKPVSLLINDFSVVYASSNTSASVEAYYSGKIILLALDASSLNLSPLRESDSALFIGSATQLAKILDNLSKLINKKIEIEKYLYLDPNISRWKEFLLKPDKIEISQKIKEF